jgi:hypothetical protein
MSSGGSGGYNEQWDLINAKGDNDMIRWRMQGKDEKTFK